MKTTKPKRQIRHKRVRAKVAGTPSRPRLNVFRSNKHIYSQLIDDSSGKTLCSVSDLKFQAEKETKINKAKKVGKMIAEKALSSKIKKVVFDSGGYKYHGRIKAVAEGAREGGLIF